MTASHPTRLLVRYLARQGRSQLGLTAVLVVGTGLQLVGPAVLGRFIDGASTGVALDGLLQLAAVYILAAAGGQALRVVALYAGERIAWDATNTLRADLLRHCLSLDHGFHTRMGPGVLVERIDGDVSAVARFFSRFVSHVAANALLLIGVIAVLSVRDGRLGWLLAALAVTSIAVLLRLRRLAIPAWTRSREANAVLYGWVYEVLCGLEDLIALDAGRFARDRLRSAALERLRATRWARWMDNVLWASTAASFAVANALGLWLGAELFAAGQLSIGDIVMLVAYVEMLRLPLDRITLYLAELQQAGGSLARIEELFAERGALQFGPLGLPEGPLAVGFEDVSHHYADGPPALSALTLSLGAGRVVGVVGRSGSGKTTLGRLVARLMDPTSGVVRIGGVDLKDVGSDELAARLTCVPQEPSLLPGTLRDNLALYDEGVTDDALIRILDELGLSEWFGGLSGGLDTLIGPGGQGMSAGEAQLVALARAFLRDPRVVVLDEASARIDPRSERALSVAIARLLRGRTGIVVAHRLETLAAVDDVMLLDHGVLVEFGAREQLERDPGSRYASLLREAHRTVA